MDIPTTPARGFTLLEMLVSVAVTAVITTVGIPGLQELMQRNRLTSEVNTFVTHLHYTRSEAVKRNVRVVMCRSEDGESCARTNGWEEGWIIFADYNGNRVLDGGDALLYSEPGEENGIMITSGRRRRIVYQPDGSSPGSNGTYVFCDPDYPKYAKAVIINNPGRPRLSETRPDGSDLGCGDS